MSSLSPRSSCVLGLAAGGISLLFALHLPTEGRALPSGQWGPCLTLLRLPRPFWADGQGCGSR